MEGCVMIMAGGTGGHVFPALAVAEELRSRGMSVFWLGAPASFEARVVPEYGYEMEEVSIKGLRGKGAISWVVAPFKLMAAMFQAANVIRRRKPDLVVGMGGFVSGPGGLVSKLLGRPLLIHEQNAVPGMTNRWLSRIADRVLSAFPASFSNNSQVIVTGNPVRAEISAIPSPEVRLSNRNKRLRLLIMGGSQGAQILNETVPQALAGMDGADRPEVIHQAGRDKVEFTRAAYTNAAVEADVRPFLLDMAEAYAWADIVICRSGALTVAELAAAGVGSILVPFPYAVDDHQTRNGHYLADSGAAILIDQSQFNATWLQTQLVIFNKDREKVLRMANSAKALALPMATQDVSDMCEAMIASGGQS